MAESPSAGCDSTTGADCDSATGAGWDSTTAATEKGDPPSLLSISATSVIWVVSSVVVGKAKEVASIVATVGSDTGVGADAVGVGVDATTDTGVVVVLFLLSK